MISKLKSLGAKALLGSALVLPYATLYATKAHAAAVTYTPLVSGTDTTDNFNQAVTDHKTAIITILVTLGTAMVAIAWLKFGFRGAAAGGLPGRRRR